MRADELRPRPAEVGLATQARNFTDRQRIKRKASELGDRRTEPGRCRSGAESPGDAAGAE